MKSSLNWKPEEDNMIRYLRNEEKMSSWNKLAKKLNIQFPEIQRSGKQCRQRYFNTARFSEKFQQDKTWSQEEDDLLCSLYLEKGSKWTLFMKQFPFKSQNTIKNRFYCCLRKVIRKLRQFQGRSSSTGKNVIKNSMLITILQLASRVQREAMYIAGIQINYQWNIFVLRRHILDLAFGNKDIKEQQIHDIAKLIHKMNYRFKCLGITKSKSKGKWEMNKKRLYYILGLEADISQSKALSDQQTTPSSDKNSVNIEDEDPILDQNSLELPAESQALSIFEEESIIFNPSRCQILEKQFCQILDIEYQPMFTKLEDFYYN